MGRTCRFVFCRQRQDERLKRGGEQKSVVILSEAPYSGMLQQLLLLIGPHYFGAGPAALVKVDCSHVQPAVSITYNTVAFMLAVKALLPQRLPA